MAKLGIRYPDGRFEERALAPGTYAVGRDSGDIVLGDPNTSSRHLRLEVSANGIQVTDVGSTNGTYDESGQRIGSAHWLDLHRSLKLGSTTITHLPETHGAGGTAVMPQMQSPPAAGPGPYQPPHAHGPAQSAFQPPPHVSPPAGAYPGHHGSHPGPAGGYPGPSAGYPSAAPAIDPVTGLQYSDKTKLAAGLLQIFVGWLGIGRFYTGHTNIAIAQLLVCNLGFWGLSWFTCGLSAFAGLWPLIDGILLLVGSRPTDAQGRLLR